MTLPKVTQLTVTEKLNFKCLASSNALLNLNVQNTVLEGNN